MLLINDNALLGNLDTFWSRNGVADNGDFRIVWLEYITPDDALMKF